MRILVGTDDGLMVIRWIEGERSGRILEKQFEGRQVYRLVPSDGGVWAVVPDEGIFHSIDDGSSWDRVADRLGGAKIRSLSVSPQDPSVVYAGTEPAAIFISTDRGGEWNELPEFRVLGVRESWRDYGSRSAHVETIACCPTDPKRVYVGVEIGGAYRTDDRGATWHPINEGIFDDIHEILVDPWNPSRVYAATGGGLHISRDRGLHWRRHESEIGELYCTRFDLVSRGAEVSSSLQSTLLLATADTTPSSWRKLRGNAGARLWVSRNAGDSWTALALAGMRDKGAITDVTTDPATEGTGLIGTSSGNLYYGGSTNAKWTRIMFGMPTVRSLLLT
ncbi:MAG: WD40/YVTN/BNR-like repeat-containing protein [Gemmatimonadota bacterium]